MGLELGGGWGLVLGLELRIRWVLKIVGLLNRFLRLPYLCELLLILLMIISRWIVNNSSSLINIRYVLLLWILKLLYLVLVYRSIPDERLVDVYWLLRI